MKRTKEATSTVWIKKSNASRIFDVCNAIFMIVFCISILFPLWDMIVKSLSQPEEISYTALNLFPKHITFAAYRYCIENEGLFRAVFVSVARTVTGTLLHLIVVSLAAYALTRTELPFLKGIQIYLLIPMFLSAGAIPGYLNMKSLGMINSFWVYILPTAFSMYNCIIVRNFFFSIDKSMEESASIDGASAFCVFSRIIVPLSKPVLATVALWQMVGQWNSWFDNMLYNAQADQLRTLQYMLRSMIDRMKDTSLTSADMLAIGINLNQESVKSAVAVIVIIPIVCVYPFIQKYFVKGIMIGAVKG